MMKNKHVVKLSILLGLTLLLILAFTNIVAADPPDPPPPLPPPPVWEKREPFFPPPEGELWSSSISAQGAVKTFYAVADAEVRQGDPNTNYGIELTMGAGYDNVTGDNRLKHRTLADFNTTTYLPPGTIIHQATLRLYVTGSCDAYSTSYRAYRISSDWLEMGVTWNNQPSFAEGYGSSSIPHGSWGYYNFDVSNLVQAWINGTYPEYGIMIRGPESSPYGCNFRDFLTKGGGGYTAAPELIVDYTLPAPALSVSQNNVSFFHQCGTPDPPPQIIEVQSNDATLNNWTTSVSGGTGWLNSSKSYGKVSSIFPDQIELSISETIPCTSAITAQIQVNASGLAGPEIINVTLLQSDQPLSKVYLPIILKNGVGGSSTAGSSINAASTAGRIALLIGVADYLNGEPPSTFSVVRLHGEDIDLIGSRTDPIAVSGIFQYDDPSGCRGLQSQTHDTSQSSYDIIITLTEEHATRANIEYAIQWIDEREDANTQVLIYFSGHGGPIGLDAPPIDEADGSDEMLGVYDTVFTPTLDLHVVDDDFDDWLSNLETEHLAVIIDACHSGGMEVSNSNRAVLTASQEDQGSLESSLLEHGLFTYYMLEAMTNPVASDTSGDGWLSIQEIYNYAHDPVANYPDATQDLYLDMTTDFNVTSCGCP